MGFAKYLEDNIKIFNGRMYEKGIGNFNILNELKQESKKGANIISPEKEYQLILNELNKLEIWLEIIGKIYIKTSTDFVLEMLDSQKKQLTKVKDEYINHIYDPRFKRFKDYKNINNSKQLNTYRSKIIESYIEYFIERLRTMNNYNDDEAILINKLYWDIEMFVEMFLSINVQFLEIPLVQYLREDVLNKDEYNWVICSNCGGNTYLDFNNCIKCKYPKEVI